MADQQEFIGLLENWANIYMFRSLSEYFDFLKTAGISIQQAFVLTFLFYNGPSKVAEICEHMMGTTAAASQMVKRLESQDFVIRTIDSADRRVRNVLLTEAGRRFVQQSIAARQDWIRELRFDFNAAQLDEIAGVLEQLTSVIQE